jgi:hypothetical protein
MQEDEIQADQTGHREADPGRGQGGPGHFGPGRERAAAAAEGRLLRARIQAGLEVEVFIEGIDADVRGDRADHHQGEMPPVDAALRP